MSFDTESVKISDFSSEEEVTVGSSPIRRDSPAGFSVEGSPLPPRDSEGRTQSSPFPKSDSEGFDIQSSPLVRSTSSIGTSPFLSQTSQSSTGILFSVRLIYFPSYACLGIILEPSIVCYRSWKQKAASLLWLGVQGQ